jgi:hypothetical protein
MAQRIGVLRFVEVDCRRLLLGEIAPVVLVRLAREVEQMLNASVPVDMPIVPRVAIVEAKLIALEIDVSRVKLMHEAVHDLHQLITTQLL